MTKQNNYKTPDEDFQGRRRGKTLPRRLHLALEQVTEIYGFDLTKPAPTSINALFGQPCDEIRLEIGFGSGEHLLTEAIANPHIGYIGAEPFLNGRAKLAEKLLQNPITNLKLFDDNAVDLLDWLPDQCLSQIDLLYPDPWPKMKHNKRRFVSPTNLNRFARVLKSGGRFCFASDIAHYVNWTLAHIKANHDFSWTAQHAIDWQLPWAGWQSTRYEQKALREGRTPAYLTFLRR